MELVLDDPDNPILQVDLEAFLDRINNPLYDKVDFSGAENLFNSIDAELQLHKHDRDRLIVFESQCLSAINYLGRLLIDYPPDSENVDIDKVKKLKGKFKLELLDIRGRIKLYKNKGKKKIMDESNPNPSASNYLPLTNKERSRRHYGEVIQKLMLSKDPERMFKELKESGLRYISEDILEYIDQVILAKHRFISDLTISNPQSKPENLGVPGLKKDIEKAELIRDLIHPKSSDNSDQTLSNLTKNMKETVVQNVSSSNHTSDNNFDKFVDEIFKLDIKCFKAFGNSLGEFIKDYLPDKMGIPHSLKMEIFLDLRHYTKRGKDDYEFRTKQLQQAAITDLLKLPLDQITLQLRRLDEREERFSRFWKWFDTFSIDFQENKFRSEDIEQALESFFNIPKFENALISGDFINELNSAARFKHDCLTGLISQVHNAIYTFRGNHFQTENTNLMENPDLYPSTIEEYVKESAALYSSLYPSRLNKFLSDVEASELDFIEKEIKYFAGCIEILDLGSRGGYVRLGLSMAILIRDVATEIGFDRLYYSTKSKIRFLENIGSSKNNGNNILKKDQLDNSNSVQTTPYLLKDIFLDPNNLQPCAEILMKLNPPVINTSFHYIGKAKGIFPIWIKALLTSAKPIIKYYPDLVYKDLLNKTFHGLDLSKDASEFRKSYKRLENNNVELDIKTLISQLSQQGKLGK